MCKILSIDDNVANQTLIRMALKDHDVSLAMSGSEGLQQVALARPDVILLDIDMPGMNGFEVCRQLKADPAACDIPVLFVSAVNTMEDRVRSYQAGGEDFIAKPFDLNELAYKIRILTAYRQSVSQLDTQLRSASSVAMTALSNSAEIGVILGFMERCLAARSLGELAHMVFEALEQYGLSGSMVVRVERADPLFFSSTVQSPLETQLLALSSDARRIVSVGRRYIFNARIISLLIKDMPVEDEERTGRLRDHLAKIITFAEDRVNSLLNEAMARRYLSSTLHGALNSMDVSLAEVDERARRFQSQSRDIMERLLRRVEGELLKIDLLESTEEHLLGMMRQAQAELDGLFERSMEIEHMFERIRLMLREAIHA